MTAQPFNERRYHLEMMLSELRRKRVDFAHGTRIYLSLDTGEYAMIERMLVDQLGQADG